VGQDFDAALAARPEDTLLVKRVVDAVRASPALHASVSPPKRRARPGRRLWMYGVAAAWLTISCVVGAARPSFRRTLAVFLGFQDHEVRRDAPAADAVARAEPKKPLPIKTSVSSGGAETTPAPAEEPAGVPRPEGLVRAESPAAPGGAHAKELFAQANAKRRAGDESGARRLYQELQQRYPQSPEAEVSRVALGRLLLERSQDPKAALDQFDRAMNQPGHSDQAGLAEEALFGRATALMRLERTDDERKTWLLLLDRFPGSVYADRAHARLRDISLAGVKDGPTPKPAVK
jgi:TolA-binding protein